MATTIHLKSGTEARVKAVQTSLMREHRIPVSMSALVDTLVDEALNARANVEARKEQARKGGAK